MIKVAMNADGKRWDVVRGAEVIATFVTIKEAHRGFLLNPHTH